MKTKFDFRILIILILTSILIVMCYFYFKEDSTQMPNKTMNFENSNTKNEINSENTKIVQTTSEIISSLTEKVELHSTYYLEESYIETNKEVKEGENILKYTNGKYLTAPYDCVIGEINIPNVEEKCTNEHYVEISSNKLLAVQFKVDETKIDKLWVGQEAQIQIEAYENKTITGNITNINSTASNGKFECTVEFENDGEVMLGMTANIVI